MSATTTTLAGLNSAVDDATTTVAELGARITRATNEITELQGLATTGGTTAPLNLAAIKRLAAYNAYYGTDGTDGLKAAADTAKSTADAAVADGGSLEAPRALAKTAWENAEAAAGLAETALDTAVGATGLATLR